MGTNRQGAARMDGAAAANRQGHARQPGEKSQPCRALVEGMDTAVAEAMAFGEKDHGEAAPRDLHCPSNLAPTLLAADHDMARAPQRIAESRNLEQLFFGDKTYRMGQVAEQGKDVEHALMVGDHDAAVQAAEVVQAAKLHLDPAGTDDRAAPDPPQHVDS